MEMDVSLVVRHRLKELGLEQRGLAVAAQVTESYISQLLARKKAPPAPNRTGIYDKMENFLKLPSGELSKLAELQGREELKKKVADPPQPLFPEFRELILGKCAPRKQKQIRIILEKEPFGEIERLVAQKLLDVAKIIARDNLDTEKWVRLVARLSKRSYEQARGMMREFLSTDVFSVSVENCVAFLEPLIESWDIDLDTLAVELVLNRKLTPEHLKRFAFVEQEPERPFDIEPGLEEFLKNAHFSGDATGEEIEFLKRLRFEERRPTPLYYYRELQNLRDPLHFSGPRVDAGRALQAVRPQMRTAGKRRG
jgi:transcriptional regulator with XRE-family HTH domain